MSLLLRFTCNALGLGFSAICSLCSLIWRLLCCRYLPCYQNHLTPRARAKSDLMHMKWSRQYYWKASKTRWMQRMIIGVAVMMSVWMLHFDAENLPEDWAGDDAGAETYKDRVKFILETWGASLPLGIRLVFVSSEQVFDEEVWSPPIEMEEESEVFLWALDQALSPPLSSTSQSSPLVSEQPQWVIRIEAATYLIASNLKRFLGSYDASEPHFLGRRVVTETTTFHDSKAGFVLSAPAALHLLGNCGSDKGGGGMMQSSRRPLLQQRLRGNKRKGDDDGLHDNANANDGKRTSNAESESDGATTNGEEEPDATDLSSETNRESKGGEGGGGGGGAVSKSHPGRNPKRAPAAESIAIQIAYCCLKAGVGPGRSAGRSSWRALSFCHEDVQEARFFHSALASSRDGKWLLSLTTAEEQAHALWAVSWNSSNAYRVMARGGGDRRTTTSSNRKDGGEVGGHATMAEQGDHEEGASLSSWIDYIWTNPPQTPLLPPTPPHSHTMMAKEEGVGYNERPPPQEQQDQSKLLAQTGGRYINDNADDGSGIDSKRRNSINASTSILWELLVERLVIDEEEEDDGRPTNEGRGGGIGRVYWVKSEVGRDY
eukprot:jgi/Bigna1/81051/fgenesh1_pg.77_\